MGSLTEMEVVGGRGRGEVISVARTPLRHLLSEMLSLAFGLKWEAVSHVQKGSFSHLLKDHRLELTLLKSDRASAQRGQEGDSLSVGAAVFCHAPCSLQPFVEGVATPSCHRQWGGVSDFWIGTVEAETIHSETGGQLRH